MCETRLSALVDGRVLLPFYHTGTGVGTAFGGDMNRDLAAFNVRVV